MVTKDEFKVLKDRIDNLEDLVKRLDESNTVKSKEIEELQKTINSNQFSKSTADLWSNLPKQASIEITKAITKVKDTTKKKEKNIVITGLPNPDAQEEEGKISKDKKAVKTLFEKIKEPEDIVDSSAYKIIRYKSKTGEKPGIIIVEFNSIETKEKIQKAAKKLSKETDYKGVYINRDLSKDEMLIEKQLRDERRKKNDELPEKEENGSKFRYHKFGTDVTESKFIWGIKDGEVKKFKIQQK
jgi:hypothetical protein